MLFICKINLRISCLLSIHRFFNRVLTEGNIVKSNSSPYRYWCTVYQPNIQCFYVFVLSRIRCEFQFMNNKKVLKLIKTKVATPSSIV